MALLDTAVKRIEKQFLQCTKKPVVTFTMAHTKGVHSGTAHTFTMYQLANSISNHHNVADI